MPESRREQRNFLPALILTIIWWLLLAGLVIFVEPEVVADFPFTGSYGFFFVLFFLAVWFLVSLLFVNTRRGLFFALTMVLFGILRLNQLGSWLNAVLLAGIFVAIEIFISSKKLTSKSGLRTTQENHE